MNYVTKENKKAKMTFLEMLVTEEEMSKSTSWAVKKGLCGREDMTFRFHNLMRVVELKGLL